MDIEPVNCVRNLGAWFDLMLSIGTYIMKDAVPGFIICITTEGLENTCHKAVW